MAVTDDQYFAKIEFDISFRGISYIQTTSRLMLLRFRLNCYISMDVLGIVKCDPLIYWASLNHWSNDGDSNDDCDDDDDDDEEEEEEGGGGG